MTDIRRKLIDNLRRVRQRIADACATANRDPSDVTLVGVTKYVGMDIIHLLPEVGLIDLGESRPQELIRRAAMAAEYHARQSRDASRPPAPQPRWHMVGHLQRNKVKAVLPWVEMVHSVDSLRLAEEIDSQARGLGRKVDILLQVNASEESAKHGVAVAAVTHLAEHVSTLPNISLCGLMTMAPLTENRSRVYDCFVRCREIYDEVIHESRVGEQFRHLSMGMSSDFDIAIAVGATMVRIGSALYEGIDLPAPSVQEASEAR